MFPQETSNVSSLIKEASLETTSPERLKELAEQNITLARIVATNINSPPELLAELAYAEDQLIRKAVASNPNTSKESLFQLGYEFPEELLNNPIFDLFFLENPNLLNEIPESTLESILKLETIPNTILDWVTNNYKDGYILFIVLRNAKLSSEYLNKLIINKNVWIAEEAKLHINWHEEIENSEQFIRQALQKKRLGLHTYTRYIFISLFTEMISSQWVNDFAFYAVPYLSQTIMENLHIPANILAKLATHEIMNVRSAVARNLNTPANVLTMLANDKYKYVRSQVARNPNTPVNILIKLASEEQFSIRCQVAVNPNTPVNILEQLVTDKNSYVKSAVATNPKNLLSIRNTNISVKVLEELATDKTYNVSIPMTKQINDSTTSLQKLAIDENVNVRSQVAKSPNTPLKILERLAIDESVDVRSQVAKNPNTPLKILERLATDQSVDVRSWVAIHPKANQEVKIKIFKTLNDTPSLERLCLFLSPYAEISHLAKNYLSNYWLERWAIAQNPNTPPDSLNCLIKDSNRLVRNAAELNLKQQK